MHTPTRNSWPPELSPKAMLDLAMACVPPPHQAMPAKADQHNLHQLLVQATRTPEFIEPILKAAGRAFEASAEVNPGLRDATQVFADAIRVFYQEGKAALAVIVEVQLSINPEKFIAWRRYPCRAMDQHGCPAILLVVCADPITEAWGKETLQRLPFKAPGFVISVHSLATLLPDMKEAIAVLGAAACVKSNGQLPSEPYIDGLLMAAESEQWRSLCYSLLVELMNPKDLKEYLMNDISLENPTPKMIEFARVLFSTELDEAKRQYEAAGESKGMAAGRAAGKAEGKAEGRAEGRAEGLSMALLAMLGSRGIELSAAQRAQVEAAEAERLDRWFKQALEGASAEALFDEPG